MGSGEKAKRLFGLSPFPSHFPPCLRPTLVPSIPLSRFSLVSRARESPNPLLAFGKPVEEAAG